MKSKNILMLVENLSLPFDRRSWLEAKALHDSGYTVNVICPADKHYRAGYERYEGVHIYRYNTPPTGIGVMDYIREYAVALWKMFWISLKLWRLERFDVIHACNPPDLLFLIALFYKPFGTRLVFDQHDLSPETYSVQRGGRKDLIYWVLLFTEWLTFVAADMVIATNESVREIALKRGHVSDERIFIVRTGPDSQRVRIVPPNMDLKRGKSYLVCYVGVMGPQDGVEYGIRAAEWVVNHQHRSDVTFVFIGSGDILPDLKKLASELNLDNKIIFTGRIPDEELILYLSTADVCISPDPKNGFNEYHTMNKTLEYMAMGKPQVAFDLPEMRVSAGDSALYACPNDIADFGSKILALLDDSELRVNMGQQGRKRIENELSWEHTQQNLLTAYRWLFRI